MQLWYTLCDWLPFEMLHWDFMKNAFLAIPAYDVISNIFLSPFLNEEEQTLLAGAFYRAYHAHMDGRTEPLDEKLGVLLGKLIR